MSNRAGKGRLRGICVDENLSSSVADQFRAAGFRAIEAARHPGFRGRDERDFIGDLFEQNVVFVTGDAEFVEELVQRPRRHAGIVFVEQTSPPENKKQLTLFSAYGIIGRCAESPRAFAGRIAYVGVDGIRVIYRGQDTLAYSWPAIERLGDTAVVQRVPRSRRGRPSHAPRKNASRLPEP